MPVSTPLLPRVENLYFSYLFMLRAVMKAAPILRAAEYNTGNPAEDTVTRALVHRCGGGACTLSRLSLLRTDRLRAATPLFPHCLQAGGQPNTANGLPHSLR